MPGPFGEESDARRKASIEAAEAKRVEENARLAPDFKRNVLDAAHKAVRLARERYEAGENKPVSYADIEGHFPKPDREAETQGRRILDEMAGEYPGLRLTFTSSIRGKSAYRVFMVCCSVA